MQTLSFVEGWDQNADMLLGKLSAEALRLQAEAGLTDTFDHARGVLLSKIAGEGKQPNEGQPLERESRRVLRLLQKHLVGDLTAEALALQLPPSTAPKTLP